MPFPHVQMCPTTTRRRAPMLSPSLTSAVSGSVVWQKEGSTTAFHPLTCRNLLALSTTKEEMPEKAGVKLLVGAGVCLTYEFALGHYLEFIKIMKQTKPQFSYVQLTQEIMHTKGFVGIWDGFFPWGALQGVAKGSVFAWGHSIARTALAPVVKNDKISKGTSEVIAGGIGGGFQGFVLSPTLLLKTRVMTDPIFREKMTPLETMSRSMRVGVKVINKEGVAALMKGSGIFSLKRVADWSTRFFFSVQAENIVYKRGNPDHVLTTSEQVISSLLGGVVSAAVTLPMDVLVAQIQQASKAGEKVSAVKLFQQQYRAGGFNKLLAFGTTGFVARFIHASFTTMIMKTATSVVYDMVEGRN